jgi:hypothetical protein
MFDFPASYTTADAASLDGQRRFITSTRIQLILLVIASAAGSLSWGVNDSWDGTALIAGVAFAAAAVLRVILLRHRPHRFWYDGRAAAESIKTLSWKYAVGGDPFVVDEGRSAVNFEELVNEVCTSFDTLKFPDGRDGYQPTASMESTRAGSLEERRDLYARERIADQQDWYSRKAVWNQRRARFWGFVVLALQLVGALGAFLKGFGVLDVDLFGLAGAAVASAAAWLETKQHHNVARAYRVAAEELDSIAHLIAQQTNEASWGRFVAEAEEAISREHTMWKASTRSREPVNLA